jgi:hypothetical protein
MDSQSTFTEQRLQVGFETSAVLTRMLEDQLDQASLARAEVSMDSTACQSVKERNRLLSEKLLEFVGGHVFPVKRSAREKRDSREGRDGTKRLSRRVPPVPHVSPFPRW